MHQILQVYVIIDRTFPIFMCVKIIFTLILNKLCKNCKYQISNNYIVHTLLTYQDVLKLEKDI